ncbi:RNA-binding protein 42-like isoform X2 [Rhopalosiphum maidis]|uniref:RNA-binding protein 42-like isoform X2 n=1 Tax=Rhopalosiphum maidis TaxID=43146 RepID=UPI000EFE0F54|nr:RNA-binding protein 42-like isoform X2 [Rhopalosiphum maidis]
MANHFKKMKLIEEEMNKFEKEIGISNNVDDNNKTKNCLKKKKIHCHNSQQFPLDVALYKEINSLLQNQCVSTLSSKTKNKSSISKSELNSKAHIAIAAAGCASSSSKVYSKKQKKFYRKAAGKVWYDPTLAQWSNDDFRLFVGNLGREVNDRMLSMPFMQYPSFIKAYVVKNRETSMSRGCYGFVSFANSVDYLRAIKELHGKYVGSRPMKIEKSNWKKRNTDIE